MLCPPTLKTPGANNRLMFRVRRESQDIVHKSLTQDPCIVFKAYSVITGLFAKTDMHLIRNQTSNLHNN